jgi:hypothetical protein
MLSRSQVLLGPIGDWLSFLFLPMRQEVDQNPSVCESDLLGLIIDDLFVGGQLGEHLKSIAVGFSL